MLSVALISSYQHLLAQLRNRRQVVLNFTLMILGVPKSVKQPRYTVPFQDHYMDKTCKTKNWIHMVTVELWGCYPFTNTSALVIVLVGTSGRVDNGQDVGIQSIKLYMHSKNIRLSLCNRR